MEFWKIKFKKIEILEKWNFEKLFLKVNLRIEFRKIKFRKLESWKNYFCEWNFRNFKFWRFI